MTLLRVAFIIWVQAYLLGPEFLKLPLLIVHYQEHLAEDDALDINDFLALHYADNGHEEADHSGHEDLPFHHHHSTLLDQSVAKVWMSDPVPVVSFPELLGEHVVGVVSDDAELAGHARALLQPPKGLA